MPNGMMTDAQVSVGVQRMVQGHRIASVCKQTYDASCTQIPPHPPLPTPHPHPPPPPPAPQNIEDDFKTCVRPEQAKPFQSKKSRDVYQLATANGLAHIHGANNAPVGLAIFSTREL